MNDILYFKKKSSIYKYADDKTVSYSDKSLKTTKYILVDENIMFIDWYKNKKMQSKPDKRQAIMVVLQGFLNCKSHNLNGIKCEVSVKLLDVENLHFEDGLHYLILALLEPSI